MRCIFQSSGLQFSRCWNSTRNRHRMCRNIHDICYITLKGHWTSIAISFFISNSNITRISNSTNTNFFQLILPMYFPFIRYFFLLWGILWTAPSSARLIGYCTVYLLKSTSKNKKKNYKYSYFFQSKSDLNTKFSRQSLPMPTPLMVLLIVQKSFFFFLLLLIFFFMKLGDKVIGLLVQCSFQLHMLKQHNPFLWCIFCKSDIGLWQSVKLVL